MTILTAGIDLAKSVFAVRGCNEEGRAELLRPLPVQRMERPRLDSR